MLRIVTFLVISCIVCSAAAQRKNGHEHETCSKEMNDTADFIYEHQCADLLATDREGYVRCQESHGIPYSDAVTVCARLLNLTAPQDIPTRVGLSCGKENSKKSLKIICCILTQEVKLADISVYHIIDSSRRCLEQSKDDDQKRDRHYRY